ncbi:tRNA uridine-5-carboxymethylaminomethyl(34) synthesis enzyme MnmG [Candidatus Margulisiibacteriota bacterium]
MEKLNQYDVIIIGAGHAGCEAALACARMGCKTIILTISLDNIALMPCNPAIGGPAKGQIVGEIDALGGEMGVAADKTFIQMKVLNRSRGQAVQCLRAQSDKAAYKAYMASVLAKQDNLVVLQAMVTELIVENNIVKGAITELGDKIFGKTVILTTGTFLNGIIYTGLKSSSAGRLGELSATKLSNSLKKYFRLGRLKTGTPPRLDARTIDFEKMLVQPGDDNFLRFSFKTPYHEGYKNQVDCFLTHTNINTHKIILDNLDRSPLYQKMIKGLGPRYCPSIEDKVVRFREKDSHQIFIEPEGRDTISIYAQGLNTSLPEDVQEKLLYTIKGLEKVKILKMGYAVEYDFVYPSQLLPTLETKPLKNLYLAGQINGTSGYEEAAGQGLIAGINAALKVMNKSPFIIKREESYIGTLIDDLITKEITEPYRMFTSRSEYRIYLRQDNACYRLGEKAFSLGLISPCEIKKIRQEKLQIENFIELWKKQKVGPEIQKKHHLAQPINIYSFLKKNQVSVLDLLNSGLIESHQTELAYKSFIEIRYEGYLHRQKRQIEKVQRLEEKKIPTDINFEHILGLKNESKEKLIRYKPVTIYEAKRIAGINPADIIVLLAHIERK